MVAVSLLAGDALDLVVKLSALSPVVARWTCLRTVTSAKNAASMPKCQPATC